MRPLKGEMQELAASEAPDATDPGRVQRLQRAAVAAVLLAMLYQILLPAFQEPNFGISAEGGKIVIRDIAAHLTFARAFWTGAADYSVASHLQITNAWAGLPVNRALPFGYAPTMLVVLAPFVLWPLVWGFAVWTIASAGAVWWMSRADRSDLLFGPLLVASPLALLSLALGQTSLVSSAAVIVLLLRDRRRAHAGVQETWSWHIVPDIVVLCALTAKPPLAVAAGGALLAGRRWRTVSGAVALTVVTVLALTPRLGVAWVGQYLDMIAHYNRETADAAFAWSLRPDLMTNLRAVLWENGFAGDAVASGISSASWIVMTVGVVAAGLRGPIGRGMAWVMAIFAFLLFCPHLSSTEDVLLVVATVAATDWAWLGVSQAPSSPLLLTRLAFALSTAVVFLPPDVTMTAGALRTTLLFSCKLAALVCLGMLWWAPSHERSRATSMAS